MAHSRAHNSNKVQHFSSLYLSPIHCQMKKMFTSPGSGLLFVSKSNCSLHRYQTRETKLSTSRVVPTQVTTHQILTLWDCSQLDLPYQSISIWQVGNKTQKSTFFQIGPLNCILGTIAKNECIMADKSFFCSTSYYLEWHHPQTSSILDPEYVGHPLQIVSSEFLPNTIRVQIYTEILWRRECVGAHGCLL